MNSVSSLCMYQENVYFYFYNRGKPLAKIFNDENILSELVLLIEIFESLNIHMSLKSMQGNYTNILQLSGENKYYEEILCHILLFYNFLQENKIVL